MPSSHNDSTHQPLLLTPQQAAEALAICPRTLWGLTKAGKIPHVRLGRCKRYSVDDLRGWINSQRKGGDE